MIKKTLYVHRQLLNANDIRYWAKKENIPSMLPTYDMHVTVAFSRDIMLWPKSKDNILQIPDVQTKIGWLGRDEPSVLVLKFESKYLQNRWQEFRDMGASWDFPEYTPHVTVSYQCKGLGLKPAPYKGDLWFGPEIFDVVNENFKDEIREISP